MTTSIVVFGFCGQGQEFTLKDYPGRTYGTISWEQLVGMAANPPQVDKAAAWWVIPSTYNAHDARRHSAQRQHGYFNCLWLDFDTGNHKLETIRQALVAAVGDAEWLAYSSRSATEANLKWRVIIPLARPVVGAAYGGYAQALNEALAGLNPDKATQRPGQLCYLPNRGELYHWHHNAAPRVDLGGHALEERAKAIYFELQAAEANAKSQVEQWGPMWAFAQKHPTWQVLEAAGFYTHDGEAWRHPSQTSPSFGTLLFPDGGIHTLSETVQAMFGGRKQWNNGLDMFARLQGWDNKQANAYANTCWKEYRQSMAQWGWENCQQAVQRSITELQERKQAELNERIAEAMQQHPALVAPAAISRINEDRLDDDKLGIFGSRERDYRYETLIGDDIFDEQLRSPELDITPPEGLLGELMWYFAYAAPYPSKYASSCAAVMTLAGLVGREFQMPGDLGLNEYLVLVMDAGTGKQEAVDLPTHLLRIAYEGDNELGTIPVKGKVPGSFSESIFSRTRKQSMQAYISDLAERQCNVDVMDEYHNTLRGQLDPKGSKANNDYSLVLELYGLSGKGVLDSAVYSRAENNKASVVRPAHSIFGMTNMSSVQGLLTPQNFLTGLMPRHLFCFAKQTGVGPENEDRLSGPPEALVNHMRFLMKVVARARDADLICRLVLDEGAQEEWKHFSEYCRRHGNQVDNEQLAAYWRRVNVHVRKVTGLVAVGEHIVKDPLLTTPVVVSRRHFEWAKKFVGYCVGTLTAKAQLGEFGDTLVRQLGVARAMLKEYWQTPEKTRRGKRWKVDNNGAAIPALVPYKVISERLSKEPVFANEGDTGRTIDAVIGRLVSSGQLEPVDDIKTFIAEAMRQAGHYGPASGAPLRGKWFVMTDELAGG